jgi:hypothetical protein
MYISASNAINEYNAIISDYNDAMHAHRKVYSGSVHIYNDTTYHEVRDLMRVESREYALCCIRWILRGRDVSIDKAARAARKWEERTNWERCLPDDVAERLIEAMLR